MLPFVALVSPPEPPVPIRLLVPETVPLMSLGVDEEPVLLPATIVSVRVAVPRLYRPQPVPEVAELSAMVVSSIVVVGWVLPFNPAMTPPMAFAAELPLIVQSCNVAVPPKLSRAPPLALAVLPMIVQYSSTAVPLLMSSPPPCPAELPLIVQFVRVRSVALTA